MSETIPASKPNEEAISEYYAGLLPFWHPVARVDEIGDGPLGVVLLERPLVIVKLGGELVAMENVCRHLGAALSLGEVVNGETLRCRYHGWEYDGTGRCVHIPLRETEKIPSMARVEKFPCQVRYGLVWVCLDPESDAKLPEYPQFDDESFHKAPISVTNDWKASMPRLVMAALDDTHFSWVHPGILGVAGEPTMPDRITDDPVTVDENGVLVSRYRTLMPANPMSTGEDLDADSTDTVPAEFYNVATVNTMTNVITGAEGVSVTFNAYMPISHGLTRNFCQLARDYDKDPARDQAFEDFNHEIKEQDREIVESQRPWLLPPLKARMILYVRPEDVPLVEYQKYLERIGVPQI